MANDAPITAGTVMEKYFGAGAYGQSFGGNVTQQRIADLVSSGNLSRQEVAALTSWQISTAENQLSQLYPKVYGNYAASRPLSREEAKLAALYKYRQQFGGLAGTWIRWLLSNEISNLSQKIKRLYGCSYVPLSSEKPKAAPTPDWMKPYIETGMPYVTPAVSSRERRGTGSTVPAPSTTTGQLRPIGAQEELSLEEMEQLAAYGAWGKAGFPTSLQNRNMETVIGAMADQERFWEPFVALSQKLFPSRQNLGRQWAMAQQR